MKLVHVCVIRRITAQVDGMPLYVSMPINEQGNQTGPVSITVDREFKKDIAKELQRITSE